MKDGVEMPRIRRQNKDNLRRHRVEFLYQRTRSGGLTERMDRLNCFIDYKPRDSVEGDLTQRNSP